MRLWMPKYLNRLKFAITARFLRANCHSSSLMVTSQFEYYNSMLINKVDSDGNALPLGGEFPLEENEHFNKLPVSTQMSNIQVPTNVYNRGVQIIKNWTLANNAG